MPSNTPNLNLYKKNPETDGDDTFNIVTMLNENFDKIDAHAGDNTRHIAATERNTWNGKETTAGSQAKADAAKDAAITAAAADATAKANAARDAATLAADAAADAAEAAAKAASIPTTQKGAAGGVAVLDDQQFVAAKGLRLTESFKQQVLKFNFDDGIPNQKVNLRFTQAHGFFEITIASSFAYQNAMGKLTKRFNGIYTAEGAAHECYSRYTDVTGNLKHNISMGDPVWDSVSGYWKVSIEARNTAGNPFTVLFSSLAGGDATVASLSEVYTGEATTLPLAVQVIPDNTETENGFKIWNSGNDGAGSGLDADMLSGIHANEFTRVNAYTNFANGNGNAPITTAEFITILTNLGAFNQGHWVGRGSWDYAANAIITDTGVGNIHLAGAVVETFGYPSGYTIRITTPTTAGVENALVNSEFIYVNNGASYAPAWRRSWNSANMPSYTSDSNANTLVARNADGNFAVGNAVYFGDNDGFVYDDSSNAMYVRLDGNNYGLYHQGNDTNLMVTRNLPSTNLDDAVIPGTYFLGANNIYTNGSGLDYGLMKVYRNPVGYVVQEVTGVGMAGQRYRTRAETGWWNAWMMVPVADASSGKYWNIGNKRWNITDVQVGPSGDNTKTIAEWTPTVKANYSVKIYMKVQQGCSIIAQIESAEGIDVLLPYQYCPADTYRFPISFFVAAPGTPIKVVVGASASNAVYVSAVIEEE
ncbi:pyocin knob domain-containing protein [Paenibacillus sp. IHBB 3054]|uniref:pyocin knob domain-containing protein n=1 Tax=Paenibacillus sp. IHBB 3054 TaxID=3425689 RepID=UPI003F66F0AB